MKKLAIALLFLANGAWAAPSVTSVSGASLAHGQTATVSGSGFGTKSPAKPIVWADFESSLNPTTLGTKTAWDATGSEARDATAGYNGTGGAVGSGDTISPVAYILMVTDAGSDGAKHYVFRRTKLNFALAAPTNVDQNTKIFRVWAAGLNYPNLYSAINNGRIFVEKDHSPDTGYFTGDINAFQTANVWRAEEHFIQQSSALNVKDGVYTYNVDGAEKCSGSVMTRFTEWPNQLNDWFVQHWVFSNIANWANGGGSAWSDSNTVTTDDVYFDNTWSRVMVSNNATLASATKLAPQIPSAWSATSITVTLQLPSNDFPNASTAYLHVCDSSNNCSAGKAFTVAGSGGSTPPTIVSVTPVIVSTSAGTSVVATCTGLTATLSGVTLGGTSLTGVSRDSATQFTGTLPAKAAGTYDLVVTNSDTLTGTLTSAITTRNRPVISTVNPTTILRTGGGTVALGGTDFVAGSTIKVGTTTASGFTFNSSSSVSFTMPAVNAGTYDITITGPSPDSQQDVKTAGLSATDPVASTTKLLMWLKR